MDSDRNTAATLNVVNEPFAWIAVSLLLFSLLYFLGRFSYILFHSIIEFITVSIGLTIFIISWNVRKRFENGFLLIFGISLLFTGIIDFLHMLAYKGMGVFTSTSANPATQLWVAARYLESLSLIAGFLLIGKKPHSYIVMPIYFFVTIAIIIFILVIPVFPVCYIDGKGLTSFKIISEYIISVFFICSVIIFHFNYALFDKKLYPFILLMLLAKIVSEIFFTAYVSVYSLANFLGHIAKLVSLGLTYYIFIYSGVTKPYYIMENNLKELSGLLPICANCKKIRDDKGYWEQVESYISGHSEAEFSHLICPDCMKKLYPDFTDEIEDLTNTSDSEKQ